MQAGHLTLSASREEALATAAAWLGGRRADIRKAFMESGDAQAMLKAHALVVDELIAALFALATEKTPAEMAVVATGGYGRGELFPYSDIDVLFLHAPADREKAAAAAGYILYLLWDLGITVGQAQRTTDETLALARQDIRVRTSLLDARLVAGDSRIFGIFTMRFEKDVVAGSAAEFIDAKLAERDERHRRYGDSRYLLEPNIKEGKGGLRDLHTLWWLARYAYPIDDLKELAAMGLITREEYRVFDRARQFLCKVRAHLHYLAGKPEEKLTFERQQALAAVMGYGHRDANRAVERFMRRYFAAARMVGIATRAICAMLEEEKKRKPRKPLGWFTLSAWKPGAFTLDGERLTVRRKDAFERQPVKMLELFRAAGEGGIDVHPRALQLVARSLRRIDRAVRQGARANTEFLGILLSGHAEATLRKMSDAGVLGRFIPEFGRITGQTQFNRYHVYTVDEHTLVAIGILHAIESGGLKKELTLATSLMPRIQNRRALYLALFCHDIAKGGKRDHSQAGAAVARKLAARMRFSASEIDTAAWLVEHHLLLSNTALKRDLADAKTIADFTAAVGSPQRLRLLYLLTVADMRAVGASVWNAWKASLLDELYARSERAMGAPAAGRTALPRQQLRQALVQKLPGWNVRVIDDYLGQASDALLAALPPAHHAAILRMLKQAGEAPMPLFFDIRHDYERSMTEITVCTPDAEALFSKLAGAMTLAGANIVSAKIFTLKSGMVVDVFQVQDAAGEVFDRPDRLAKLSVYAEQAISGEIDLAGAFAATVGDAQGQVFVENGASNVYTVIEITGQDRPGLLYRITRALSELKLSIGTAHVSTYGAQAADVFYVKDAFGMKVTHAEKIQQVRDKLLAAINQ